jgi:hypothetical protein
LPHKQLLKINNLIPKTKYGDCGVCPKKHVRVIKRGKTLYCITCALKEKRSTKPIKKIKSSSKLVKASTDSIERELDGLLSRYIRLSNTMPSGLIKCYTCNYLGSYNEMECGHYIKREHKAVRWDINNVKPQCNNCNCFLHGNIPVYRQNLERDAPGMAAYLESQKLIRKKYYGHELQELKLHLTTLIQKIHDKNTGI